LVGDVEDRSWRASTVWSRGRPLDAGRLNLRPCRSISHGRNRSVLMLALGIILGFVVVLGAINYFEFGRVD
jgi:hypothetical protein